MAGDKRRGIEVDGQRWMVTFSDLITLLLTFFVLNLAMSSMEGGALEETFGTRSNGAAGGGSALVNLTDEPGQAGFGGGQEAADVPVATGDGSGVLEAVADGVSDLGLDETIEVRESGRGLYLTLPGDLLFSVGSARLSGGGEKTLRALVPLLQRPGLEVSVEGHTDGTVSRSWSYRDNWDLSLARAVAVATVLEAGGINPARLSVAGYGSARPRVAGRPAEVGQYNRRVELLLHLDHPVHDIS